MVRRRIHYSGRDIRVGHRKEGLRNVYVLTIDDEPVEPATFEDEQAALSFARTLIDDEGELT